MIDPATIAPIITGLVSSLSAYMTYRVGMKQAEHKSAPEPTKPAEQALKQGEQSYPIVKAGVEQHGTADEQADLASFERNPQRYEQALIRVLQDVVARNPAFAEQLQALVPHAAVRGSAGASNVGGDVYGTSAGVIEGDVHGEYHFGDTKKKGD